MLLSANSFTHRELKESSSKTLEAKPEKIIFFIEYDPVSPKSVIVCAVSDVLS